RTFARARERLQTLRCQFAAYEVTAKLCFQLQNAIGLLDVAGSPIDSSGCRSAFVEPTSHEPDSRNSALFMLYYWREARLLEVQSGSPGNPVVQMCHLSETALRKLQCASLRKSLLFRGMCQDFFLRGR